MSEVVIGVRLSSSGGQDVAGEVRSVETSIGKLGDATKQAASEAEKLNAAQKNMAERLAEQQSVMARQNAAMSSAVEIQRRSSESMITLAADTQKLIDRYDPLGAKLRGLQADFKALNEAAAGAQIPANFDRAADAAFRSLQKQMADTQHLMDTAGGAVWQQTMHGLKQMGDAGEHAHDQMSKGALSTALSTAQARRELIVIGHEAMTGNFSRMPGSFMVLAERMGQSAALFNPITIGIVATVSAIALWAKAFHDGAEEEKAMNNALAITNDYAGMTRGTMRGLAQEMTSASVITVGTSKEIVTQLVASGQIGAQSIGAVARIASDYAAATGKDIAKIAPDLIKLVADPAKGAEELNKQMHFLAPTELEHIAHLERVGQLDAAQLEFVQKWTDRVPKQIEQIGYLGAAWDKVRKAFSGAVDAANAVGREKTPEERFAEASARLAKLQKAPYFQQSPEAIAAATNQRDLARADIYSTGEGAAAAQAAAEANRLQNQATALVNQVSQYHQIAELRDKIVLAGKLDATTDEQRAAKADALRKLHLDIQGIQHSMSAEGRQMDQARMDAAMKLSEVTLKMAAAENDAQLKLGTISQAEHDATKVFLDLQKNTVQQIDVIQRQSLAGLNVVEKQNLALRLQELQVERAAVEQGGAIAQRLDLKKQEQEVNKAGLEYAKQWTAEEDKQNAVVVAFNTTLDTHVSTIQAEIDGYKQSTQAKTLSVEMQKLENEYTKAATGLTDTQAEAVRQLYDAKRQILPSLIAERDSLKARAEMWKGLVDDVDHSFRSGFMRTLERGENMWGSFTKTLANTFKTGVADYAYRLFGKPIILTFIASAGGSLGMTGLANAASVANGAGGGLSLASGLNTVSGWFGGPSLGPGSLSGLFGSTALGTGLMASSGTTAVMGTAAGLGGAAGMGLSAGTGLTAGAAGVTGLTTGAGTAAAMGTGATGLTAAMAAIPGWGWAALGAAAIGAYILNSGDGDAQRTGNWEAALGQVGGSSRNKWFDSSTGAGPFAAELAANEQKIITLLNLSSAQTAAVNSTLTALSGKEYGFGMEHTDWTQSGAAQAIAADRFRAVAQGLGMSVEALTQKMVDAQKVIDLAPQKRQMEIALMEAQGKTVEALAAKREDELKALDPTLQALQKEIYAAQDLANAANDATGAVGALAKQLTDVKTAAAAAVDAQIQASQSASQTARQAADSYRQITATLTDTVRQLRGGDLSPLLPAQKLAESRGSLDALFGKAMTGDAAALSALPQVATDFLTASRAYNASSEAYTADFNRVMNMLAQAQAASAAMTNWEQYQATLLQTQTGVLEQIKAELAKPSPDTAILAQQAGLLSSIHDALLAQTTQVVEGNTFVHDQTGKIVAGNALIGTQTSQIITGNSIQDAVRNITALDSHYSEEMLRALVTGATTQSDSLQGIYNASDTTVSLLRQLIDLTAQKSAQDQAAAAAAEQQAAADRALAQQTSQATAAYQAQKAISDANLAQFRGYVSTMPGGEHVANANENIAANSPFGYSYFEAYVGQEDVAFAKARELQTQYLDAFAAAYSLYKAIPGHAAGLPYVPSDDYLMRAHKGEAVVDAGTMSALRSYGIQVGAGITKADLDDLKKSIEETNAILQRVREELKTTLLHAAESASADVKNQTAVLATAVEESALVMGRVVARSAEASTRA